MKERIQKVVAESGLYSRRAVERLIDEGKVKVNGVLIHAKGIKVDPECDRIQIDGKAFRHKRKSEITAIVINKPRKVMVTRNDPEGRKTVYDLLPQKLQNLKPVGRLDLNSQGLLILTDDGDLILKLTHPRYHLEKLYHVKVSSHPSDEQLDRLSKGIILDGQRTLPPKIKILSENKSSTIIEFRLLEGKNRQIRRMCEAVGLTVKELKRLSIGPLRLRNLRSGQYRYLSPSEIRKLQELAD